MVLVGSECSVAFFSVCSVLVIGIRDYCKGRYSQHIGVQDNERNPFSSERKEKKTKTEPTSLSSIP